MDSILKGNFSYIAKSSPLLFDLIFQVTKSIDFNEKQTVYDRWFENDPNEDNTAPNISPHMGAGSDFSGNFDKQ